MRGSLSSVLYERQVESYMLLLFLRRRPGQMTGHGAKIESALLLTRLQSRLLEKIGFLSVIRFSKEHLGETVPPAELLQQGLERSITAREQQVALL